jgi:hypothetical protein
LISVSLVSLDLGPLKIHLCRGLTTEKPPTPPPPPPRCPAAMGDSERDSTPLPPLGLFLGEELPPPPPAAAARGSLAALADSGPLRPPLGVPGERGASRGLAVPLSAAATSAPPPLPAAAAAGAAAAPSAARSCRAAHAPATTRAHATAPSAVPTK